MTIATRTWMVVLFFCLSTHVYSQDTGYRGGIIPAPQHVRVMGGMFRASSEAVRWLRAYLPGNKGGRYGITIVTGPDSSAGSEGYRLKVTSRGITLTGDEAGIFYGVQTLLQLLARRDEGGYAIPCVDIDDYPRFSYRGLMLDVSRHFYSVEQVKQVLDLMARYKLNVFHWHLTDDQGWRLEIKKYPRLTSVGAWHENTVEDGDRDEPDSVRTGGYYTQEQVREVVRYAAARCITIIPEIEVPAHSAAALRAYPELKCALPEGVSGASVAANAIIYCPSEPTFQFLDDVLTEVTALFPGKYIHIGGDEANKLPWEASPFCQGLMKRLGLKDVHELQSYFIRRIEKILLSKGRSLIGWDEIAEGGLASTATVMCRRGTQAESRIVQLQHKVIMTPGIDGLYFDYPQSNSALEPFYHGSYISPLEKTYSLDPAPASLTGDEKKLVMGVQGSLWTEHVPTMNKLYYMIIPRIFGLAEIAWTLPENKNKNAFLEVSVPRELAWLEDKGYNFRVPTAMNWTDTVIIGGRYVWENKCLLPGARVYYTLNGRMPTENDREYTRPLELRVPSGQRRELRTMVISRTGRRSVPTRVVVYNYDPFPAVGSVTVAADSARLLAGLRVDTVERGFQRYRVLCTGYVDIPADGVYSFFLPARDSDKLFIDDHAVIADDSHFSQIENIGAAPLQKGLHRLRLDYTFGGSAVVPLYYQGADGERRAFTTSQLFH
ncbi:MAG TPA: family 20 glycosylhydrolase [Puia sp.]|nr:family 20 glycosylhydrolase [Puia sp.]